MGAEQTLRAYIDAFNRADVDGIAAAYHDETEYRQPFSPVPLSTPEAISAFEGAMFAGFSDVSVELEWLVANDDRVAAGTTIRATHTGTMPLPDGQSLAPTGQRIEIRNADYMRVNESGRIVEHVRYGKPRRAAQPTRHRYPLLDTEAERR